MNYRPNAEFNLYTDTETGEVFATYSGLARLCGVSEAAIRKRFKGANLEGLKKAEMLTEYEFEGANQKGEALNDKEFSSSNQKGVKTAEVLTAAGLRSSNLVDENSIKAAVKHYAKTNETASQNLDIFLDIGIKVYIHNETKFNPAHESVLALFKQLRGYHKVCHVQWQQKQEAEGLTPSQIANKYISLFDRVSGLTGAYKMYKKMGAKTACDLLHPSLLQKLDEELMK